MRFVDRLGAAVAAPGKAFAEAEEGRGGTADAGVLLALSFVCAELPTLVQVAWTGAVIGVQPALSTLLSRLFGFVGDGLVVWAVAGVAITVATGRRRSPSRDFDLAGVAFVPYLLARLILAWVPAPRAVEDYLAVGLAAVWVILAVLWARRTRA